LEILEMPEIDMGKFEVQFVKENENANTQNFAQCLMTKPEIMENVFQQVSNFIETVMVPQKIYVQTN
jgi:hypothetical protein